MRSARVGAIIPNLQLGARADYPLPPGPRPAQGQLSVRVSDAGRKVGFRREGVIIEGLTAVGFPPVLRPFRWLVAAILLAEIIESFLNSNSSRSPAPNDQPITAC